MIKDLLPIGSIVVLHDSKKRIMINGIKQTNEESKKEYDYSGVLYPEGYISEQYRFLFNHDDISQIFFRGFEDIERQEFINKLDEFYEQAEHKSK